MKFTDFSNTGGFPLDLDVLEWDRSGLWEALGGMYSGAGTTPLIIAGMHTGSPNGWVFVDSKLMPYYAPSFPPPLSLGSAYYIRVNKTANPATFEDSSVHNVLEVTYYADLIVASSSATPTDCYLYSSFKRWEEVVLGVRSKTGWYPIWSATTGSVVGSIIAKKDLIANTLQVQATIGVSATIFSPSDITTPVYRVIGATLPVELRPANNVPITLIRRYAGIPFVRDAAGVDNIHTINGEVQTSGDILFGFLRPAAGVSSYTVVMNQIIPLG